MAELTDEKLNEIVRSIINGHLEWFEEEMTFLDKPLSDEDLEHKAFFYGSLGAEKREQRAKGDYRGVSDSAGRIIEKRGLDIEKDSPEFKRLCREILRAESMVFDVIEKRVFGDYSTSEADLIEEYERQNRTTPQPALAMAQPIPLVSSPPPAPEKTSATLEQAIQDYWEEHSGDLKPRSRKDYRSYLDHITNILGPKTQLHEIDYEMVREFREGLRSGEKTVHGDPLSVSRINNYLMLIKAVYDLAMRKDKNLDRINPAEGLRLKDRVAQEDKRQPFSDEDLKKMFIKSKGYGEDGFRDPQSFWIPLIALFTGARLEEICQLHLTDIIQKDGIWCMDINEGKPGDLKSVKTSERRLVPLHPFLINDLKFIQYVESIDEKKIRVFPELTYVSHRWGHGYGRAFGEFKKKCGIVGPRGVKSFHSFRHTLINHLKQNGASVTHVKEFVGHKGQGDITNDIYSQQYSPQALFDEVVLKIKYELNLTHLKDSKFAKD